MEIIRIALLPVTVVLFGITLAGVYDVTRRAHTTNGSKGLWVILIVIFNALGVFLYYRYGRTEPEHPNADKQKQVKTGH